MSSFVYLTQEGYDKLKEELHEMRTTGRAEAAAAIAEAREKGDLSENAEYDAAKDEQGKLEARIVEAQNILANARVLDTSVLDASKVGVFSKVKIRNIKTGKEFAYQLVSETEADIKANKISTASPIGKALLGKTKGEIAVATTPNGNIEFEILDITLD